MFGRKEIEQRLEKLEMQIKIERDRNEFLKDAFCELLKVHAKYKLGDQVEFNNCEAENRYGVISKVLVDHYCRLDYRITDSYGRDFSVYENRVKRVIKNVCKK